MKFKALYILLLLLLPGLIFQGLDPILNLNEGRITETELVSEGYVETTRVRQFTPVYRNLKGKIKGIFTSGYTRGISISNQPDYSRKIPVPIYIRTGSLLI